MLRAAMALTVLFASAAARDGIELRVTGHEFGWLIRYAGTDGRLDTADDVLRRRHLHLPAHTPIRLELASEDYVYGFRLPALDVVEIAVPGRPFLLRFETDRDGLSRLMGDQMCGFLHAELIGDFIVESRAAFEQWMRQSEAVHAR